MIAFLNILVKNTIKKSFNSLGSKTTYTDDSFLSVSIPLKNKTLSKDRISSQKK